MFEYISIVISLLVRVMLFYYCVAGSIWIVRKFTTSRTKRVVPRSETLKTKKLMVVFGSGGHTTEMLLMLTKSNEFDFSKYQEVQFVIGKSDTWSLTKIKDFLSRGHPTGSKPFDLEKDVSNLKIIKLFRSREVK